MKRRYTFLPTAAILAALTLGMPAVPELAKAQSPAGELTATAQEQPWAPQPIHPPLPDEEVVVEINGRGHTVRELKLLTGLRPPEDVMIMADRDVPRMRGEDLGRIARHVGTFDLLAQRARERGIELAEEDQQRIDGGIQQYMNALLYQEVVTDRQTEPSEEELRARYEEMKDTQFRREEELQLRHIWVSTYIPYTVEEGDTLESIAERIGGDAALVDRIISPQTGKPRVEELDKPEDANGDTVGESLPPRALVAGEELLVPAPDTVGVSAREKIEAAHRALEEGGDFLEVAQEYSESERPGGLMRIHPGRADRPMMPELTEAFMSLEDGAYSEPIETRHGYQIIYREQYTEGGHTSFENVRVRVADTLRSEQVNDLVTGFFDSLVEDPEIARINSDILDDTPELEDVVVTIGEEELTYARLKELTRNAVEREEYRGVEGIKNLLKEQGALQGMLISQYKANRNYADLPEVIQAREHFENTLLAHSYLEEILDEQVGEIDADAIAAYYEENKERYYQPESFEVHKAVRRIDPGHDDQEAARAEAITYLKEKMQGVQSLTEFTAMARETNPPNNPRLPVDGNLDWQTVRRLPAGTGDILREVSIPGPSPVFIERDVAAVYWVTGHREGYYDTLEEREDQIRLALRNQRQNALRNDILQSYQGEVRVNVLAKD